MAGLSGSLSISGNTFEEYKVDGNEVVHFRQIHESADLEDDSLSFKPTMCHQIFGECEQIFGYKDLNINIFCSAARMITYVKVSYSDKLTAAKTGGVEADDIYGKLSKHLQPGFLTNIDEFVASLANDAMFSPYGEQIHAYTISPAFFYGGKTQYFAIYHATMTDPGFRSFHERIQPFLLFYVDAASYIEPDDEKWTYYLLFEKIRINGNDPQYGFVGYMTAYNYYSYPDKVRPRLSQFLILPPYQKKGHGVKLLQAFYNHCFQRNEVLDITVEDPSEDFQRLRDYVDAKQCSRLASYQPVMLKQGFNEEMSKEAREMLKLNKRQARRVYEILRLKHTNVKDDLDYKNFRLDIKRRLNAPFQKNGRDFNKLKRALDSEELAATVTNLDTEQRQAYLQKEFEQVAEDYRRVIDRLKTE